MSQDKLLIEPAKRELRSNGEIVIGNNFWLSNNYRLGDKVAVLAGVHIGNNVIVAANAVVTKDLLYGCIVAGVLARIIKYI